jgi:uncharacterized membrane protein
MVTRVAKAKAKEEEKSKEEEQPQTTQAPPPPRTERYEKQEKGEKHEKQEKQEKHEKETPGKSEKHEKRGWGVWGLVFAGTLLVAFGIIIFLANWYSVPSRLWWPLFLIIAGIAVIIYVIIATTAMHRSPLPA